MTGIENVYVEPTNHPGIKLNMSYGQCACFMCCNIRVTNQERDLILGLLAADVVRKDPSQGDQWVASWAMRHGPAAHKALAEHINRERKHARA